jgi:chromosomal replication initiator protein
MTRNVWSDVRRHVQGSVGENNYVTWIQPLTLASFDDGIVRLTAPTNFVATWVGRNYIDQIERGFRANGHDVLRVEIAVAARSAAAPAADTAAAPEPRASVPAMPAVPTADDLGQNKLDPRQTFEHFVVGKPNLVAHAAARRVAEGGPVGFNPLFLYSGVGLGKTHLMNAIAWELRARFPEKKVLYLSAERFMFSFVRALRDKTILDFKSQFRSVDVLLIDDVQFIAGKDSTQEEFFHTFNALIDQNRQIVLSADRAPGDIKNLEERIKSRLQSGLTVDLHPTDYELRLGILQSKLEANIATHGQVVVDPGVLEFLADRITSSVRALEGAINRLCALSSLVGREITLDMAQDSLSDMLRSSERRISVEEIQRRVAEHFNVRLSDMIGPKRLRTVARPRQVAMYLSKTLTTRSLPDIGRRFGGRDHTTILHGIRKIEELRDGDPQLNEDIEMLRRQLQT